MNIMCTRPRNKGFISVLQVQNSDFFQEILQTKWVVPKTVSGVLPADFLFYQALLLDFQNRPGGHVYLEGHAYLAGKSMGGELKNLILLIFFNIQDMRVQEWQTKIFGKI